ncbi:transmembrane protein, putative (macronuclear) [Tetrahymena thermophila SB210]|uniref:Transmembrane protein, putative n=1 Tax=Tetrahymena thermophila (strain SB210) TaxID=312017 RepID=Q22NI2_TETTS|nr:transmembrane protein, putative [Tetrahymena thermophila SB210]EAR86803.1 transmembrane protein, putative [Tetrahymena thermophila SB210]|eukprot:XP_001007048.1 transmembrane protein, putative [Tetrahymena thermophila SB210]
MTKLLIFILIALSVSQAYEICSTKGAIQYYCPDGQGCCSDTTCGVYCSGGGSGGGSGFPWYGYLLIGIGVLILIACIKACPRICRKKNRQRQQQQQLLQA